MIEQMTVAEAILNGFIVVGISIVGHALILAVSGR